jgi:hypothetical protein
MALTQFGVGAGFPRPIAWIIILGGENSPLQYWAQYFFKCHQFVGHFLAVFPVTFQVVYNSAITPSFSDSHTLAEASNGRSKRDFFISYTAKDRKWAEWIAWQLEAAKFTLFIQAWDFGAGSDFIEEMDRASQKARRTIAVISPDYFKSKFTKAEWHVPFAEDATGAGSHSPRMFSEDR